MRWQRPAATTTGKQGSVYYCAQATTTPLLSGLINHGARNNAHVGLATF